MKRDLNYETRIYEQTGRGIELTEVTCGMCNGCGFSQFEDHCEVCDGRGTEIVYTFKDAICDHLVELCDCKQDFQLGAKGFAVRVDPDEAAWLGVEELEMHLLRATMRKTDHLMTMEERAA